jgi:hypothetical protein
MNFFWGLLNVLLTALIVLPELWVIPRV